MITQERLVVKVCVTCASIDVYELCGICPVTQRTLDNMPDGETCPQWREKRPWLDRAK